jgi:negative regulator of replication initiation
VVKKTNQLKNKTMNQKLIEINTLTIDEVNKEKISLIEDNFKVMRLLFGLGFEWHKIAITEPGIVFDQLYEMNIMDLECLLAFNSATASLKARELAGFASDEQPIKRNN